MLNDRQAVALQGVVTDLVANKAALDPFQQRVLKTSQQQLIAYERGAVNQKREPYRLPIRENLENLTRFENDLNAKTTILGEDIDKDPDLKADTIGLAYLSSKFQKPEKEVFADFPSYKKALKDQYGKDNFASALMEDISVSRDNIRIRQAVWQDAFTQAARGKGLYESVSEFTQSGIMKERQPDGVGELYGKAFREAQVAYSENLDQFTRLNDLMTKAIEEPTLSAENTFAAAQALMEIPADQRQLAFTFLQANQGEKGDVLRVANESIRGIFQRVRKEDVRSQTRQIETISQALEKGEDLFVIRSFGDGKKGLDGIPAAMRAMRNVMSVLPARQVPGTSRFTDNPRQPFRPLTDEESIQLEKDLDQAGDLIRFLVDIEGFVGQSITDAPEGFLEGFTEKVVYGSVQIAPEMAYFIGTAALGRGIGSASSIARMRTIASAAAAYKGNQTAIQVEHFKKMLQENPDMDTGAAYRMSAVSGSIGAAAETASDFFVISKLPGLGKLVGRMKRGNFSSPSLDFLKRSGQVIGAETLTELSQDHSASLVQSVYAAVDADIPEINLSEAFTETLKTAPDIALAMLPFALLAGGKASYVTLDIQKGFIKQMEEGSLDLFLGEDTVNTILAEPTLSKQIAALKRKVNLNELDGKIQEALETGVAIDKFLGKHAVNIANFEPTQSLSEPVITPLRNEEGDLAQWHFEDPLRDPEADPELFSTKEEAVTRAEQWYEENGVPAFTEPSDQVEISKERSNPAREDSITREIMAELEEPKSSSKLPSLKELEEGAGVPHGWFLHGRASDKAFGATGVAFASKDINVAQQFSGKHGKVFLIKDTSLMDLSEESNIDEVVNRVMSSLDDGTLPVDVEEVAQQGSQSVREALVPESLVSDGGLWDVHGFTGWFFDEFNVQGAKFPDETAVFVDIPGTIAEEVEKNPKNPDSHRRSAPGGSDQSQNILQRGRPNAALVVDTEKKEAMEVMIGGKKMTLRPDAPVSGPEVINALTETLQALGQGGAIRTGRIHPSRRAAGYFHPRSHIIRIKTANMLPTAAHEAGHALDVALFGHKHNKDGQWEGNMPGDIVLELRPLGRDLYGNKEPKNGYASEGFAEFFRLFTQDPDQALKKAPKTTKWLQEILDAMPEVAEKVSEAQVAGTTFFRQGSKARALATIARTPGAVERFQKNTKDRIAKTEEDFLDSAITVQRFWDEAQKRRAAIGKARLSERANPMLTLSSRRLTADAIVEQMATVSMLDYAGNRTTGPLSEVFSLVQGKVEEFIIFLYAKRTIALATDKRGSRASGLDPLDAANIIGEFTQTPNFELAAQKFYDWHNGVLDYVAQAAPSMQEAVEKIREVDPGFYLPLQREFETVTQLIGGGSGVVGKDLVKKLRGSTRRIKDPIESSLAQAKKMIQKADQVRVIEQIIRIASNTPGLGSLAVKVDRDSIVSGKIRVDSMIEATWRMVEGFLETNGVEMQSARQGFEEAIEATEGMMHVMFSAAIEPRRQNEAPVMPIYRYGKLEWWELDPSLYIALKGMEPPSLNLLGRLFFQYPAQLFRTGTTGLNAGFAMISNPLRDFSTLHKNSQAQANTGKLFMEWMQMVYWLARHTFSGGRYTNPWIDVIQRMGVKMAQPLNQDGLSLKRTAGMVKLGGKRGWRNFKTLPGNAYDVAKEVLQFTELAARGTEIKLMMEDRGLDPASPLTPYDRDVMGLGGKRVSTDFTRSGKISRKINMAVPFFNAAIQGPMAHIEAAKRDPVKFSLRGLQATALALIAWWFNKDEEWWQEMDEDERYLYTYIQIGDELLRIPRAFEADGLFMAGAEALADAWYQKDPATAGKWFREWLSQLGPIDVTFKTGETLDQKLLAQTANVSPVLLSTAIEQAAGRDFFFDTPIIPRSQADLFAEEQFSPFTTTMSIELGKLLNISPRRIDHAIRSVGGGVALDIVALLGRGEIRGEDPVNSDWQPADIPAFGRLFQRDGNAYSPKSIDKFYDEYGKALKIMNSDRIDETPEQRADRLILQAAATQLSGLRQLGNRSKKREVRQAVESYMISIARSAVEKSKTRSQMKSEVSKFIKEIEAQNAQDK